MTKQRFTALGCHIYAGGFSLGVRQAGFELLGHLEEWPFGVETAKQNLGIEVWRGDWDVIANDLKGKVDMLYGNPPCASWSSAGVLKGVDESERWKGHGLTDCTLRLFALAIKLKPKVFVWECVSQIVTQGKDFLAERTKEMTNLGYHVYQIIFDAKDCGLPQRRRRSFFVASQVKIGFTAPNNTPVTVREALKGIKDPGPLMPLNETLTKIMKNMPINKEWSLRRQFDKDNPGHVGPGRPGFLNKRLCFDGVACTITGGPEFYHPTEPRRLSVLEQQVLCGFPPDYKFSGSVGQQYRQVGKGVTPPAARWLATQVFQALQNAAPMTEGVTFYDFSEPKRAKTAIEKQLKKISHSVSDMGKRDGERRSAADRLAVAQNVAGSSPVALPISKSQAKRIAIQTGKISSELTAGAMAAISKNVSIKAPRGLGIGAFIRERLAEGEDPETILIQVHEKFPSSKATKGDIAWNKRKMVLDAPQPIRRPDKKREEREFDKTQLRETGSGRTVGRDYAAHFFRWGFIRRFVVQRETTILDVGCGQDKPLPIILSHRIQTVPKLYVGVDLNKLPAKGNFAWAKYHEEFNFIERVDEILGEHGTFKLVVCFEVIEHMSKENGIQLLFRLHDCCADDGILVLSTPVYNGTAARNHIHEWTISELQEAMASTGWLVAHRYGTFASHNDIKKVLSEPEKIIYNALRVYYDGDVTSCFLAPLHPDESRNNVWIAKKKKI